MQGYYYIYFILFFFFTASLRTYHFLEEITTSQSDIGPLILSTSFLPLLKPDI